MERFSTPKRKLFPNFTNVSCFAVNNYDVKLNASLIIVYNIRQNYSRSCIHYVRRRRTRRKKIGWHGCGGKKFARLFAIVPDQLSKFVFVFQLLHFN